jgi:hypothetical protein
MTASVIAFAARISWSWLGGFACASTIPHKNTCGRPAVDQTPAQFMGAILWWAAAGRPGRTIWRVGGKEAIGGAWDCSRRF